MASENDDEEQQTMRFKIQVNSEDISTPKNITPRSTRLKLEEMKTILANVLEKLIPVSFRTRNPASVDRSLITWIKNNKNLIIQELEQAVHNIEPSKKAPVVNRPKKKLKTRFLPENRTRKR
jgi:hypothetical protein